MFFSTYIAEIIVSIKNALVLLICLVFVVDYDNPVALIVLAEEELVVIDLSGEDWTVFRPAYLYSLHCSAVTCTEIVSDVSPDFYKKIKDAGLKQSQTAYSNKVSFTQTIGRNVSIFINKICHVLHIC